MSDQSGTCNAGGQATFSVPPTANRVLIASSLGTFLPTGRLLLPPSSTSNQLHLMSRLQGTHWEPLEVGRRVEGTAIFFFFVVFASLSLFSLSYRFGLGLGLSLCHPSCTSCTITRPSGMELKNGIAPLFPSFQLPSTLPSFLRLPVSFARLPRHV